MNSVMLILVFYKRWLHPSGYVFKWSELTMMSVGSEETGAVAGFREDVDWPILSHPPPE